MVDKVRNGRLHNCLAILRTITTVAGVSSDAQQRRPGKREDGFPEEPTQLS